VCGLSDLFAKKMWHSIQKYFIFMPTYRLHFIVQKTIKQLIWPDQGNIGHVYTTIKACMYDM